MNTPRLEIDLGKIYHNSLKLVEWMKAEGICVSGVTKAFLGEPKIARVILQAGVEALGDSRIENIERMRHAGITSRIMLIRSPMLSQVKRVVASADLSVNTEMETLLALSQAAILAGKTHEVLLMVELGDLREGIMPADLENMVQRTISLPNIKLMGIGANLACRSGISPDQTNMGQLSQLAGGIEASLRITLPIVSGGNSSNLNWVFKGRNIGRINHLRLGESILLGREPLQRKPIDGLYLDAIRLFGEVIESKIKPMKPWGTLAQSAFDRNPTTGSRTAQLQTILAIGVQDVDPDGLVAPQGFSVLNASSDHLIINTGNKKLAIGEEVRFQLNYSALLRAMTSPHVEKTFTNSDVISQTPLYPGSLPIAA